MAQAQVDFQNQEHERHLQEEKLEEPNEIATTEISFPLEKTMKELNQNIFSDDKAIKNYNNSKVKARNFLTNVSYTRIVAVDYKNKNFVVDCFTFLILYLNPFYLERKFESTIERDFIHVLWNYLMPNELYRHISSEANIKILIKIKIKYQDAKDIMIAFLFSDPKNIDILSGFLEKNAILYQFLFGNLFPKCFSRINDYGINAKTLFNRYYRNYYVQKNMINNLVNENLESPLNMTTLNDDNDNNDVENIEIKQEEKEEEEKEKKRKRKIKNEDIKKEKREAKKQKLIQELNENTEKLKKLKKKTNK